MKKILLSCACCLLAVGLLAGCDEDVEDATPEDPNAGVVEPSGDDGGSTESGPVVVKTGKLGFLQENKGAYYYFTGELNDSGFGVCSTEFSEGTDVTVSKEEDSYFLSIEVEKETLYLSCPDTEHSPMELSKDPYALVYNAEFDTFTTVDDTKFLGTYGDYDTLCWANLYYNGVSNLGAADEFCASVFTEAQSLPAPTTLTVTGSNEVYVGNSITLTATVNDGADKSVTWSWAPTEGSEGEVTVEGGKVTGVTAGEVVVTATSAVAPSVSDSITITVLNIPDVFPYEFGKEYFLGYDRSGTYYYFNGDAYGTGNQAYYGGVTTDTDEAAKVVIEEVEGGYALKCNEKYLYMEPNDSYHNFKWDGSETKAWDYDYANDVFTITDSNGDIYYMGTSGTYNEITMNAISTIASNIPAHLIEPSAPTEITITASKDSVSVNGTLQLTLTYQGAGALKGVTWSSSDDSYATVSDDGLVTGVAEAEKVTITATSTVDNTIKGSIDLAVTEEIQGLIGTLDFSVITDTSGSQIKETTALDSCWVGDSDVYTGLSDIDSSNYPVYTGSGSGGAFPTTAGLIKFGKSGAGGTITFNFAEDTGIKSAVISAHSFYESTSNSYKADDTLYVNNTGLTLSSTGTPADVIWTDDTGVDALTLSTVNSSSNRAYVFSITLYSVVLGD